MRAIPHNSDLLRLVRQTPPPLRFLLSLGLNSFQRSRDFPPQRSRVPRGGVGFLNFINIGQNAPERARNPPSVVHLQIRGLTGQFGNLCPTIRDHKCDSTWNQLKVCPGASSRLHAAPSLLGCDPETAALQPYDRLATGQGKHHNASFPYAPQASPRQYPLERAESNTGNPVFRPGFTSRFGHLAAQKSKGSTFAHATAPRLLLRPSQCPAWRRLRLV